MQKASGANCEICPLQAEKFVPTVAPEGAQFLFIGEAPGMQETIYKKPFVGPSGKLLKKVMKDSGIPLSRTAFTNTVLCRPPNNADPPKDAISCCRPRLEWDIKTIDPEVIFPVGSVASQSVLENKQGILAARVGPPKQLGRYPHARIIPTVHPAFVLRSPLNFSFLETDLRKYRNEPQRWTVPNYVVATSRRTALRCLYAIKAMNVPIAIDIEVAIDKETEYEHPTNYELLCLGIAYGDSNVVVLTDDVLLDPEVGWAIRDLLSQAPIIAQNGKFDLPGLSRFGTFGLSDDTLLASYVLDERSGVHSLEYLGREFLGSPDWKSDIADSKSGPEGFGGVPRDALYRYNAFDCAVTYRLRDLFDKRIKDDGLSSLYAFLVRASNALMKVEEHGLLVDQEYLEKLEFEYTEDLQKRETELLQWVANPRSWQQVQKTLLELGVRTESTDEPHLNEINEKAQALLDTNPQAAIAERLSTVRTFLEKLLGYRHEQKRYGTYVKGTRERLYEGRIYPTYLLHGTRTGRLSARNPNIQNVPRGSKIRRLFVAGNGNTFVQADYAQGELRLVTTLAQCSYFSDLFNDPNADPISTTQRELFGNRVTQVGDEDAQKFWRVRTKSIIYGSLYGMVLGRGKQGRNKAREIGMSDDEAFGYQKRFFAVAPEILQWQTDTRARVLDGEILSTVFGRRLRINSSVILLDDKARIDFLNECLAFIPQSTLSDVCLTALCDLSDAGVPLSISLHDALVAECELDSADRVSLQLRDGMERSARLALGSYVPFPVETKMATNWGDL